MTRASIREYTEAVRGRYLRASKMEKGRILDEFTKVIGCHLCHPSCTQLHYQPSEDFRNFHELINGNELV